MRMATHESTIADEYYGLLAEFASSDDLLRAAEATTAAGYRRLDAYSPMPIEGLAETIGHEHTRLPFVVLAGGIVGAATGYFMQWWMTMDYPLNIGGRPLHSWPAFIPVTFELTILFASLAAVLGMLAMNGLPRPHHPLFAVPEFSLATQDRYFLCIETSDPQFDVAAPRDFLLGLGPTKVTLVES
jgi:hypothetical protein